MLPGLAITTLRAWKVEIPARSTLERHIGNATAGGANVRVLARCRPGRGRLGGRGLAPVVGAGAIGLAVPGRRRPGPAVRWSRWFSLLGRPGTDRPGDRGGALLQELTLGRVGAADIAAERCGDLQARSWTAGVDVARGTVGDHRRMVSPASATSTSSSPSASPPPT